MQTHRTKTRQLVGLSVLAALIVILQLVSNSFKVGGVSITLSLVPIVVGGALYGVRAGTLLGGILGLITLLCSILGIDPGGAMLWNASPLMTTVVCLLKTTIAGGAAALAYKIPAKKHRSAAVFLAGIVCPVVNTGLFCLSMPLFFWETLVSWAGGTNLVSYVVLSLTGLNFVLELLINLVLSPTIVRIIELTRRGH